MPTMISSSQKHFIRTGIQTGIRPDGRPMNATRKLSIETQLLNHSSGSAKIELGGTRLFVQIKISVGAFQDGLEDDLEGEQEEGNKYKNGSICCTTKFMPSVVPDKTIATFVSKSLNSSIDLKQLVIIPGVCFILNVDILIMENDGNLLDVVFLGCKQALVNLRLPKVIAEQVDGIYDYDISEDETEYLKERELIPISTTVFLVGKIFILDPTLDEELCADSKVTVVVDYLGNVVGILKDQKPIDGSILIEMIKLGRKQALETFSLLKKF